MLNWIYLITGTCTKKGLGSDGLSATNFGSLTHDLELRHSKHDDTNMGVSGLYNHIFKLIRDHWARASGMLGNSLIYSLTLDERYIKVGLSRKHVYPEGFIYFKGRGYLSFYHASFRRTRLHPIANSYLSDPDRLAYCRPIPLRKVPDPEKPRKPDWMISRKLKS